MANSVSLLLHEAAEHGPARLPERSAGASGRSGLRIVHLVRQYEPSRGGLEDFVKCLAREQASCGHAVEIVTLNRLFHEPGTTLEPLSGPDGFRVRRLPFVGSSTYFVARGIAGAIAGADVVHVHATDFFFDFMALYRPFLKGRLVCTTHGGFFHTSRLAAVKKLWFKTLTRTFLRAYDAIVACSRSDYETFAPFCQDRIRLIDNGVDIDKFCAAGSPTPVKTIVTIGRFSSNKRVPLLLERFRELADADPDWRLRICGVNSDLTEADLTNRARELGIADKVFVHLNPDDTELRAILAEASLFASASSYEGFGMVAVEAMSAGLRPILHANAAYEAMASHHPGITIIDFAAPGSLAQQARAAHDRGLKDYARARRDLIGASARYAWQSVARNYQAVYEGSRDGRSTCSGSTSKTDAPP